MTGDGTLLGEFHCIRLCTYKGYEDQPASVAAITQWRPGLGGFDQGTKVDRQTRPLGKAAAKITCLADVLHEVPSLLYQYYLAGSWPLPEAVALLRDLRGDAQAPPRPGQVGETVVILAEAAAPFRRSIAETLIAAWQDKDLAWIKGGALASGLELFASSSPELLVLLTDPAEWASQRGAILVAGPLRIMETCLHKLNWQFALYQEIRGKLVEARKNLQVERDRFLLMLHSDGEDSPEAWREELKQNSRMGQAYLHLVSYMEDAHRMKVGVEANRANIRTYLTAIQDDPAQGPLAFRQQRADTALAQIETDLSYGSVPLDTIRWMSQFHQASLLTDLSIAEAAQKARHQKDGQRNERLMRRLTILGIWVGATQIWAAAVAVFLSRPQSSLSGTSTFSLLATSDYWISFLIICLPTSTFLLALVAELAWGLFCRLKGGKSR